MANAPVGFFDSPSANFTAPGPISASEARFLVCEKEGSSRLKRVVAANAGMTMSILRQWSRMRNLNMEKKMSPAR